ncbi:hypothetical protein R1flu_017542 [Riccia fluitans]|uniref:Uncharacterized protein n=1 Tax=Riccia fluitans TaxID=41844 RepID=A0ABD1ZH96_9MARC
MVHVLLEYSQEMRSSPDECLPLVLLKLCSSLVGWDRSRVHNARTSASLLNSVLCLAATGISGFCRWC